MKRPAELSEELLGAMIAAEPVAPLAWALAQDDRGRPLYVVAYAIGPDNIGKLVKAMHQLRESGELVEVPANFAELNQIQARPPGDIPPTD